jgi:xanthine dehydrogenase accessory factor
VVAEVLAAVRLLIAAGDRGSLITAVSGSEQGECALLDADGRVVAGMSLPADVVAAAAPALDRRTPQLIEIDGESWFVEPVMPPPKLIVLGAIAVAEALAPMATAAGYAVHVIDTRDWLATEEKFPTAVSVRCGTPLDMLREVGIDAATSIVSFLHEARLEDEVLIESLRNPIRYVGSMGSSKTTAAKRSRLSAAGLDDASLERLRAPIGLAIGSRTPQEIAVSVLAEVVAVGRGHLTGGSGS